MNVTISYFGQLRQLVGVEREAREAADGASVQDLVRERAQAHGETFARIALDDAGDLRRSLMLLRNGESVDATQPTPLADGDEISLLPPIAGG